ncbi:MAG: ATP-binding cassette domain-containing protein [Chloroflexi bacterium]|nr:ATP-binding cassette domain-containing protein [Chloroflexota bacterium]
MPLIELDGVSFTYRGATEAALRNLSLSVDQGEFVGVIGPTGAGKSTLCWVIVGVAPQILQGRLEGRVRVKDLDPSQRPISEIAQVVALVQQDAEAQLLMTDVEKEIIFPLENLSLPREEIGRRLTRALELTNLASERLRHPFYLSGGQKQRVAVAAALAMEPEILILDEATSELDPIGAEEVHRLAGDLKSRGKTILMVEHNIDELAKHADRIVVLDKGEKVREGPTREILTDVGLLTGLGIYPPQVTQVSHRLASRGFPLHPLPLTLKEALQAFAAAGVRS